MAGQGPSEGQAEKQSQAGCRPLLAETNPAPAVEGRDCWGQRARKAKVAENVPPYPISLVMINSGFISKLW
jgi:hypothetical protein